MFHIRFPLCPALRETGFFPILLHRIVFFREIWYIFYHTKEDSV